MTWGPGPAGQAAQGLQRVDLLKVDVERAELDVLQGVAQDDWLPNPTLSLNLGPSVSGFLTRPLRCNLFKKPLMSAPSQAKPGSVAPGFMHQARPPCARTDRGGGPRARWAQGARAAAGGGGARGRVGARGGRARAGGPRRLLRLHRRPGRGAARVRHPPALLHARPAGRGGPVTAAAAPRAASAAAPSVRRGRGAESCWTGLSASLWQHVPSCMRSQVCRQSCC